MERMTDTLRQVQTKNLLGSLVSKRRILADIAAGIEHLHSRKIVHRYINRENVLLRVAEGKSLAGRK